LPGRHYLLVISSVNQQSMARSPCSQNGIIKI
jgi:hypothetical protein